MPKRVLGDDPFSTEGPDATPTSEPAKGEAGETAASSTTTDAGSGAAPAKAGASSSSSRASKRPPAAEKAPSAARTSKRPGPAKASKRPPASGAATPRASKRPGPARVSKPDVDETAETLDAPVDPAESSSSSSSLPFVSEADPSSPIARSALAAQALPVISVAASAPPGERSELDADDDSSGAPADLPPDMARAPEVAFTAGARTSAQPRALEEEIRDLEEHLDRLLEQVGERGADRETLDRMAERLRQRMDVGGAVTHERGVAASAREEQSVFDVARELLSSDYYLRQWGRVAMRDRSEEVDDFGLDPKYAARWRPFFDFLYERWWRVETRGIENVPSEGKVVLCANHSGALPFDGAMLATALRREHPARRELRWLAEDFIFHFPFVGVFMNRIGAVRACQENAERLLRKATCVGVFPEGVKGIAKLYRDRYRLQRFGRGGHVKLAIRTRTPIVPVAILGAEETHPLIAPTGLLAKMLGVPYVPVTPTFPWLGPAGLIPLPSKWKIYFLDPLPMDGYAPEAADDDVLVGRLNEKIRGLIQDQLEVAVRERRSVFRG